MTDDGKVQKVLKTKILVQFFSKSHLNMYRPSEFLYLRIYLLKNT